MQQAKSNPAAPTGTTTSEVSADTFVPYVRAEQVLPELTVKALVLGVILAIVLGAANMYLGLRVGLTVSASIPAAVMSMGILRMFRKSNILENNVVQTFAASGEAVAAGIVFTIPALLLLTPQGAAAPLWTSVHIGTTIVIAIAGGILGVLFCIPLRRAYIVDSKLPFPEGVACGEVLKSGEEGGKGVKVLVGGILTGAFYSVLMGGLRLWEEGVTHAVRVKDSIVGFGTSLAPILLGVGYIVGLRVGTLIVAGSALAWFVLIPLFMATGWFGTNVTITDTSAVGLYGTAAAVWSQKIRLVGGGAMVTGGLYTLWKVRASIAKAVGLRRAGDGAVVAAGIVPRTDQDISRAWIVGGSIALALPILGLYYMFTQNLLQTFAAGLLMVVAGFFFSAVAGYMAGVVGSSNNPISGVTILTLVTASLLLVALGATGASGMLAALGVGAVICVAGAMAGDTLQDLKAGYIVGCTPRKQQIAQILGVLAFGITAPFILQGLVDAYGFVSASNPAGLQAPQAFLMSRILEGIFGGTLDWNLVLLGMAIGAGLAALKQPVMPVAVGIYLPLPTTLPIFFGGLINWAVERRAKRQLGIPAREEVPEGDARLQPMRQSGLLYSSGIIAGEAIMGIVLAAFILAEVDSGSRLVTARFMPLIVGLLAALALVAFAPWSARVKTMLAGAVAIGGGLWTWLWVSQEYAYGFSPHAHWPGLLVFAYVALLVGYVPLREVLKPKTGETPR